MIDETKIDETKINALLGGLQPQEPKTARQPRTPGRVKRIERAMEPGWRQLRLAFVKTETARTTGSAYIHAEFRTLSGDMRAPFFCSNDPDTPKYQMLLRALIRREVEIGDDADLTDFVGRTVIARVVVNHRKPHLRLIDAVFPDDNPQDVPPPDPTLRPPYSGFGTPPPTSGSAAPAAAQPAIYPAQNETTDHPVPLPGRPTGADIARHMANAWEQWSTGSSPSRGNRN